MIQDAALPDLLNQFEQILDDDPLINEVGFIHPSQLAALEKRSSSLLDPGDDHFWIQNHKLGISSDILLQLYAAARKEFMNAVVEYKKLVDPSHPSAEALETAVMKHSKALLLLSPDFGTAWNSRKLIASKKQQASMFIDELRLSALVLSYSPKSEQAWCHRRWVVKNLAAKCSTLPEILEEESDLVEKIAERSKMNYRAWNHRCWLVSYMDKEQVLQQLKKSKGWAALNVADNSCFHYRMRLIIRILEDCCRKQEEGCCDSCVEVYWLWQEELEWNEELIKRYLGREALWLYRRFLSLLWIRHFASDVNDVSSPQKSKSSIQVNVNIFLDKELLLVNSCSEVLDVQFDDYEAQAICSASYLLWLTKAFLLCQFFTVLSSKARNPGSLNSEIRSTTNSSTRC
ncbi:Protein prenyltransferase alpha subunit repeat-containing protein 1-B (Fragment) [Linum grandiflorum]